MKKIPAPRPKSKDETSNVKVTVFGKTAIATGDWVGKRAAGDFRRNGFVVPVA